MCLRQYKQALWRGQVNDFSLQGLQGRDMNELTIGVMGTGRIGLQVLKNLSGFGCRLLAYDVYKNPEAEKFATYVDQDTIYKECDVISLHMSLFDSTYHIILHQFRNVIMTQHMAFYTKEAVESMVRCGIEGLVQMEKTGSCRTMLTK